MFPGAYVRFQSTGLLVPSADNLIPMVYGQSLLS